MAVRKFTGTERSAQGMIELAQATSERPSNRKTHEERLAQFLDTGALAAATALVEELWRSGEMGANAMLAMVQQIAAKKSAANIESFRRTDRPWRTAPRIACVPRRCGCAGRRRTGRVSRPRRAGQRRCADQRCRASKRPTRSDHRQPAFDHGRRLALILASDHQDTQRLVRLILAEDRTLLDRQVAAHDAAAALDGARMAALARQDDQAPPTDQARLRSPALQGLLDRGAYAQ